MRKRKPARPLVVTIDGNSVPSLGAWADLAQVDVSTISKILKEGRTPAYPTAQRLAGAIGVSTDRLYRWLHEQATA